MIQEILLNSTIIITGSTAILTFIDMLMSSQQKKRLTDYAELFWIWLDDQKAGRFLQIYLEPRVQKSQIAFVYSALFIYFLIKSLGTYIPLGSDSESWDLQVGFPRLYDFQKYIDLVAIVVSMVFTMKYSHPYLINKLGLNKSIDAYLTKGTVAFVGIFMLIIGPIFILIFNYQDAMFGGTSEEIIEYYGNSFVPLVFYCITALVYSFLWGECLILALMMAIGWVWALAIILVSGLFWILQFAILKISQNPKGPVLAISAFLAAMGGIIKLFVA